MRAFQALEENNALIMENSHLSAQISRLEMTVEDLLKENAEKQAIEISSAEFAEVICYYNHNFFNNSGIFNYIQKFVCYEN